MIRIAVVDDEKEERKILLECFQRLQAETNISIEIEEFVSGNVLLESQTLSFDIICLDIDMPGVNGMDTARQIREKNNEVILIFITNMAQMAIQGYEVRALDFILKPVNYYSFSLKINNAIDMIMTKKCINLLLYTSDGVRKISTDELLYLEVNGHYLTYHTKEDKITQKATMNEIEKKLNNLPFVRCNNCYLVHLKYVERVEKDAVKVGEDWLKISRPRKKDFLKALANYLGGVRL